MKPQNRPLTQLKNIGPKIANRLNQIGITDEKSLRKIGPAKAHQKLKALYPQQTLPVCYYLYSFEGALTDTHWNDISESRKKQLRAKISEH